MISTTLPFVTSINSVQALRCSKDERLVFSRISNEPFEREAEI